MTVVPNGVPGVKLTGPAPELKIRVFSSFEDAETYRAAWDELVARAGLDIYQTFDWSRIWWRHYGMRRQLFLVLGFADDRLIGVVPAFVDAVRLGPARITVAKLVGSDFSLQICNLAIEAPFLQSLVSVAVDQFFSKASCDLIIFAPLSGPTAKINEIQTAARVAGDLVQHVEILGAGCSTRIELPADFPEYLKNIGSRQRGNYTRAMNQFVKTHKAEACVVSTPDELRGEFERFAVDHQAQWGQDGKLGHFGDWPRALEFNWELIEAFSRQNKVRFFNILAAGEVATSQFCFVHNGVNYWRLPARACNAEWDKFSLGKLGLVKMVEDSIREGVFAIEGGRGHYDYKVQLGGHEWPMRAVQIVRRGFFVRGRVEVFRAFARLLNFVYYKIFVLRVAPRVPAFRRPLWSLWIRSTW